MDNNRHLQRGIRGGLHVFLWTGAAMALAGCVINPYIKSPTAPAALSGDECRRLKGLIVSADSPVQQKGGSVNDAMAYAVCTQRAMERKAGKYAWMNQGGAVMLMHMAGLAGYSGTRGGHTAQVAAMTTGGATFYGAQQYLYHKPREATYWLGSEALSCAIAATNRRLVRSTDKAEILKEMLRLKVEKPLAQLAEPDAVNSLVRGTMPSEKKCKDAELAMLNQRMATLRDDVARALQAASLEELNWALLSSQLRLKELSASDDAARSDLIDMTNAIRTAVGRQLATQQPDPAGLAKLLNGLKLPTLAGPVAPPTPASEAGATKRSALGPSAADVASAGAVCQVARAELDRYEAVVQSFIERHSAVHDGLNAFAKEFNRAIKETAAADDEARPIEQCLHLRGNTLGPFRLALAQAGPIKLKAGDRTTIPIEGGTPLFNIEPLTDDSKIKATVRASATGGYEIMIVAENDAKGKSRFFASDSAGGSALFTVEISE